MQSVGQNPKQGSKCLYGAMYMSICTHLHVSMYVCVYIYTTYIYMYIYISMFRFITYDTQWAWERLRDPPIYSSSDKDRWLVAGSGPRNLTSPLKALSCWSPVFGARLLKQDFTQKSEQLRYKYLISTELRLQQGQLSSKGSRYPSMRACGLQYHGTGQTWSGSMRPLSASASFFY